MCEEETCDWCAINLLLAGRRPPIFHGEQLCWACWINGRILELEAALEDSPPQT
jgi:hypothetical protein